MTDLTEQFSNNEIDESKLYYFKQKMSEEIEIGHPFSLNMVRAMDDTYLDWFLIEKVLAPVPSYEEWLEKTKSLKVLAEEYCKEKEENAELKTEYEKECHRADELEDSYWKEVDKNKKLKELLKEIISDADLSYCDSDIKLRIDEVLK